ncbi:MAG: TonB-dependent receptor [Prevotellaceae bacterium]|jgi:TonB-linked SusC/RagA family outer membrane protein|nr:TonB-dependent receptor [Prevotellaceae bacterium]
MAKLLHLIKTAKKKNCFFSFFFFLLVSTAANAQQTKIEGQVLDSRTNEPVAGASVVLVADKVGTITDIDGKFSLNAKTIPATLAVNLTGYKTEEIDIYEYTEPIAVFVSEDFNKLNEVVVVGYGTQKRKELTGSVASIPQEALKQPVVSFDQVLAGAVPGVNVSQNSGQPGSSSTIRIRGGNSINGGNEPLYVIDGFIVYNENNNAKGRDIKSKLAGGDAGLNLLSTINPADIESIDILKDASATAIYGTRGANGVIIITTKKGGRGTNHVSYQGTVGWSQIAKKPNLLNGEQWWSLYRDLTESNSANAAEIENPNSIYNNPQAHGIDPTKTYDWAGEILRKGLTHDHQVTINGGDAKGRYAVSGNYTSQDGIIKSTDYERYAFRVNLDRDVFKNFRIGVNAIGSHSTQNTLGNLLNDNVVNDWVSILRTPPVFPVYNADGSYHYRKDLTLYAEGENAIADLLNTTSETKVNRVLGNFFAEYKILPELVAKVNLGADLLGSTNNYYVPASAISGKQTQGLVSKGQSTVNSWQSEFTLNYNKTFNDIHQLDALLGYTIQRSDAEIATAIASNPNDITKYHSLQSGTAQIPYSYAQTDVLLSYLGRVNYTLLGKYNLTATLRADGSSRFSENNRWAYFPAAGLSWNANEEAFLKDVKTISNLKLRVSAGLAGSQEIPPYLYEQPYIPETYSFDGTLVNGYVPTVTRANPDLRWEKTAQYNAGIDLGLWEDRLTATFDAYYKKTSDLLLLLPVSPTTGYEDTYANSGSVENKGIELGLTGHIVKTKNFNYVSSLNFSRNKNEILDLGGYPEIIPQYPPAGALSTVYPTIVRPGQPLGTFYGYQFDGIIQNGDDLSQVPTAGWIKGYTPAPGVPKFVDQNHDGVVDENDKVVLGNTQPKFTLGFNNSFSYKRWDLSFYLSASYGNKLYNALRNRLELPSRYFNVSGDLADRWTATNPNNEVPAATEVTTLTMDSRYIEDASFLRLKNLTIGYTIPFRIQGLKQKSSLRIFATAQNLFTITKYTGFDPEASRVGNTSYEQSSLYQGVDYGAYPSIKTFLFGINVNL